MGIMDKLRRTLLGSSTKTKPATAGYRQSTHMFRDQPRDLPDFNFTTVRAMNFDPTVRLGLRVRAAPICQAELGYKDGDEWISGVQSQDPDVAAFVRGTIERFWYQDLEKILDAQRWGWSGAEVLYRVKENRIVYDRILSRHAVDTVALTSPTGDGRVQAVRFSNLSRESKAVDLPIPRAMWHAYDAQSESPYGWPVLLGCYSPWADKWFQGGALDVRRLFMRKDAYRGGRLFYPPGSTNIDGKGEVPNRDIAREIVEQMLAGDVETYPSIFDPNGGGRLWEPHDPRVASNPQHILQHPKDLDVEILRGIDIPDDVLTSENGGAWEGKQVPMMAFYSGLNRWIVVLLSDFVRQVVEPLVLWNFGKPVAFSARMKPLEEQMFERMNSKDGGGEDGMPMLMPEPGMPPQGPPPPSAVRQAQGLAPPQRMSLEQAVAKTNISAYEAARSFWDNGPS